MSVPNLTVPGFSIPCIGFGTYKLAVDDVETALDAALETGYRHIDCAHLYLNEEAIGNTLKRWFDEKKIDRKQLFVTSKPGDAILPVDESGKTLFDETLLEDTWKAMEGLVKEGLVLHIGLSNFNESQIQRIINCATIKPVMLQIESNLHFPNQELIDFATSNGILCTAFAPLGSPYREITDRPHRLIDEPILKKIAERYGKTPAQVAIRHGIQRGICVVPKSRTPERIRENFQVFDFELTNMEMKELSSLGIYQRQIRADPMRGNQEFPFLELL